MSENLVTQSDSDGSAPVAESEPTRGWPGIWGAIWISLLFAILPAVPTAVLNLDSATEVVIGSLLALLLVLPLARWRARLSFAEMLPMRPVGPATLAAIVIAFGGVTILLLQVVLFSVLVIPIPEFFAEAMLGLWENRPMWFVMTIIVAPIGEELLFRGVILRGLTRRYPVRTAVWVSTLLFTVVHFNPWQALVAFPLGLLLAWLYLRTQSLLPCIVAHAACNLQSWLLSGGRPDPGADMNQLEILPIWLLVTAATLAALGFWLLKTRLARREPLV